MPPRSGRGRGCWYTRAHCGPQSGKLESGCPWPRRRARGRGRTTKGGGGKMRRSLVALTVWSSRRRSERRPTRWPRRSSTAPRPGPRTFDPIGDRDVELDAASPIYNRLVELERGVDATGPGAGRILGCQPRRQGVHLSPPPWGQVAVERRVHAIARLQRRRRDVHLPQAARSRGPLLQAGRRQLRHVPGHGHG